MVLARARSRSSAERSRSNPRRNRPFFRRFAAQTGTRGSEAAHCAALSSPRTRGKRHCVRTVDLINNRQGGRRRGRGGQGGGRNLGGGQPGNRQDNRQRGNAAQLLEKYKSMARDAQLAGDRVQTEYYLQFADHYYRVLGENRSRFEEQNPRRSRDEEMDEEDENNSSSDNERGFQRGEAELEEAGEETSGEERGERQ